MTKTLTILLLMILGTATYAHSKISSTVPENEAVLVAAPVNVKIRFAKKVRLIKVEMNFSDQPSVRLDLGDQKSFATEFEVPLDQKGPGDYVISWRGLSIDGHAMNGEFMFVVE